jgi:trehalose synthase
MEPVTPQTSRNQATAVQTRSSPTRSPQAEPRKLPRYLETPPVPPPPPHLDDYTAIVGRAELDELRFLAEGLKGKTLKMINSTAVGGGVAEMLNRLVPLLGELEVVTRWEVITGGNDFFEVTKAFHNALHGSSYHLTRQAQEIFLMYNEQNRQRMQFNEDVIVLHDPQPAALIQARDSSPARWVWRCHIDLSNPNPEVWNFLRPFVERCDAAIFSSQSFARQLPIPQYLFYPCIDPLSEKNRELDESFIQKVCDDFGIDRKRPIVTQVSRFDRLKDPVGVVQAYRLAKKYVDCQLVLAGGGASDDPEGAVVLQEVKAAAGDDPDVFILDLPPWCALEVNALQRASTLIVQKSIKEGFRADGDGRAVERETYNRGRRRRYSQPDHPETHRRLGSFRGRLRLPDTLPAHSSRFRPGVREKWARTRERKFPHHHQRPEVAAAASASAPGRFSLICRSEAAIPDARH